MRILPVIATFLMTAITVLGVEAPVRHVVSFKFKADATPEQVHAIESAFAALKTKIPQIQSLEWGTNVSEEKLDKGFTHMWVLGFADAFVVDFQPRP